MTPAPARRSAAVPLAPRRRAALLLSALLLAAPLLATLQLADRRQGHAGRSRRELLAVFAEEGGFSALDERDYFHRRCTALKVHVKFRLVSDGHAGSESPEDVVLQAAPYIDPYFVFD